MLKFQTKDVRREPAQAHHGRGHQAQGHGQQA